MTPLPSLCLEDLKKLQIQAICILLKSNVDRFLRLTEILNYLNKIPIVYFTYWLHKCFNYHLSFPLLKLDCNYTVSLVVLTDFCCFFSPTAWINSTKVGSTHKYMESNALVCHQWFIDIIWPLIYKKKIFFVLISSIFKL